MPKYHVVVLCSGPVGDAPNQYVSESKSVAYCRCCGQAVDMDYYRRHANDSQMDT